MSTEGDPGELAAQCRALADQHPGASLERRAWLCCGVALATTRTVPAARLVLAEVTVHQVRERAYELLDQLAQGAE
ncbi:MAG: hypothetical protein JWO67_6849 [Streptosporangiaceae bacterium]|nr:hypothetical protein [Streptosporangiaceae bacterium]